MKFEKNKWKFMGIFIFVVLMISILNGFAFEMPDRFENETLILSNDDVDCDDVVEKAVEMYKQLNEDDAYDKVIMEFNNSGCIEKIIDKLNDLNDEYNSNDNEDSCKAIAEKYRIKFEQTLQQETIDPYAFYNKLLKEAKEMHPECYDKIKIELYYEKQICERVYEIVKNSIQNMPYSFAKKYLINQLKQKKQEYCVGFILNSLKLNKKVERNCDELKLMIVKDFNNYLKQGVEKHVALRIIILKYKINPCFDKLKEQIFKELKVTPKDVNISFSKKINDEAFKYLLKTPKGIELNTTLVKINKTLISSRLNNSAFLRCRVIYNTILKYSDVVTIRNESFESFIERISKIIVNRTKEISKEEIKKCLKQYWNVLLKKYKERRCLYLGKKIITQINKRNVLSNQEILRELKIRNPWFVDECWPFIKERWKFLIKPNPEKCKEMYEKLKEIYEELKDEINNSENAKEIGIKLREELKEYLPLMAYCYNRFLLNQTKDIQKIKKIYRLLYGSPDKMIKSLKNLRNEGNKDLALDETNKKVVEIHKKIKREILSKLREIKDKESKKKVIEQHFDDVKLALIDSINKRLNLLYQWYNQSKDFDLAFDINILEDATEQLKNVQNYDELKEIAEIIKPVMKKSKYDYQFYQKKLAERINKSKAIILRVIDKLNKIVKNKEIKEKLKELKEDVENIKVTRKALRELLRIKVRLSQLIMKLRNS